MQDVIDKYYDSRIQTNKGIISDIAEEVYGKNKKMLVFGLGYDSSLWYNLSNKNTFFVEDNKEYIEMNKDISDDKIIQYGYEGITVSSSFNMTDDKLSSFIIPKKIIENAPYDIIYIDGPCGYKQDTPGRLLPIFWSKTFLSKTGTIIYIDDCNRPLEKLCVDNYFNNYNKSIFNVRCGCIKIVC
jgi:hypothetical protein